MDLAKVPKRLPTSSGIRATESPGMMSGEGSGGHHTDDDDRSVKALWASYTNLDAKLEALSHDVQRILTTTGGRNENPRDRNVRAPPTRVAREEPIGAQNQRRARRFERPAPPPEFSGSDEDNVHHRRFGRIDSESDKDVENWTTEQPRYLHHLHPPSPSFSSHHHLHTTNHIPINPLNSIVSDKQRPKISNPSTNSRIHSPQIHHYQNPHHLDQHPNQFHNTHTRETHKNPNHQFTNIHENKIDSPQKHHTQYRETPKPPNQQFTQSTNQLITCETRFIKTDTQSTEIPLQPPNMTSTNSNSKPRPILPGNRPPTLTNMMQFVSKWFEFEENENNSCDVSGDIIVDYDNRVQEKLVDCFDVVKNEEGNDKMEFSGDIIVDCDNNVQGQLVDCFEVVKNVGENVKNVEKDDKIVLSIASDWFNFEDDGNDVAVTQGAQFESSVEANENGLEIVNDTVKVVEVSWNTMISSYAQGCEITLARNLFGDSVRFAEPMNDDIMLSVFIGQIVSTLGFGFENVKTKGVSRRQWQIAWSFSAFRWTIVLVPLWVWDALRRDFSVGVYHSHKTNRFPPVVLLATRCSISACFNRIRGRILFKEWVN